MKELKVGDTVYVREPWTSLIIKAKVSRILEDKADVNYRTFVDRFGHDIDVFGGSNIHSLGSIYATAQEAYEAFSQDKEELERVDRYLSEIKTKEDLLAFSTTHCMFGDNIDYAAVRAYKIKCKELLGITIR